MKFKIVQLFLLLLLFFNLTVQAFTEEKATELNPEQQAEIIQVLSKRLAQYYVLPSKAKLFKAAFIQASKNGEFSSNKTIKSFINQINNIIQKTYPDKHLGVLAPTKFSQVMAMFHGDSEGDAHEKGDSSESFKASHHGDKAASKGSIDKQTKSSSQENETNPLLVVGVNNVSEISRDGLNQTGYLSLARFDGSSRAIAFIEQVFSTFTESDNIIIDIRHCAGGDAEMVSVLSNYFFDQPTHLLNTVTAKDNNGRQIEVERWTKPNQLSKYFANKPLSILISAKSFSAAESFAFGMQVAGRATLIGETTAGGGYTNDFYPLAYGLGASISVGRTYDHRTGKDWQGIGVTPDVKVEQDHALHEALLAFTKQSGKLNSIKGEQKRIYQQIQKYTNAWYGADAEVMREVILDGFIGIYSDVNGDKVEKISRNKLIENTLEGKGTRKNKIHYNRIIQDIQITNSDASVTLILRESVHHMLLKKVDNDWLISRDEFKDKIRT